MRLNDAPSGKTLLRARVMGIENLGVLAIMLAFILVVVITTGPKFFTATNLTNLLRSVSVTGIMAAAVTLVLITGNIDLSLGWMIGFAACITGVHSDSMLTAVILALGAGALCGALNGILVGVLNLNAFITTLGTMYVFKGVTMLYANQRTLTASADNLPLKFIGQGQILGIPTPIWVFAAVALIFWFLLKRTTFGTKVFSVGANPVAARFAGVSSKKTILIVYILAGLATGLAGVVFYTKVMNTQPYSGVGLEFDVLTAVVLGGTSITGGRGNVIGTVLGVVFVGVLANGFTLMGFGANAQYITLGAILLVAMRADIMKSRGLRA